MNEGKEKTPGAGTPRANDPERTSHMKHIQDTSLVRMIDGEPKTDTMIVATKTGNQHASVIRLIRDNVTDFEKFGRVGFEIAPFQTAGGMQSREVASLNEQQATLLITYLRNTDPVRDLKVRLVQDFYAMRQALTAPTPTGPELMARALIEANNVLEAKDEKIAVLEPKADAYEAFMNADGTYSIGRVAKMLGRSQNKLFAELRNAGVLIAKGHMHNTPYQRYMHHFKVTPYSYERKDDTIGCSYTTTVQPSGVEFIRRKLGVPFVQHELEVAS